MGTMLWMPTLNPTPQGPNLQETLSLFLCEFAAGHPTRLGPEHGTPSHA